MVLFLEKWSAESVNDEHEVTNPALDVMKRLHKISEQLDPNNKSCLTAMKVREDDIHKYCTYNCMCIDYLFLLLLQDLCTVLSDTDINISAFEFLHCSLPEKLTR